MQADHSNKMDGMVAIVTGASRGLGRAIAKEFAAEGAKVVVSARRSSPTGLPGTAVETAEQIRSQGGEAMALTCDVSNEEQVTAMVGQTIDTYGRIDVLVNNAGVIGSRMGSDHGEGGGVLYSSTKAAVHMFSLCLADEVREHNIAVNILSPGALKTEGSAAIPWTQRDWAQRVGPEAVGPSAVYLALQDASTFTGQLVHRVEFGDTWGT